MLKLYRKLADGSLSYHEAWVEEHDVIEHWGVVGTRGETKQHPLAGGEEETELERILAPARQLGFEEIEFEAHAPLMVEFIVEGMGTARDLAKREELEHRLNELLGWTGLGECDGGSIGSGSMEVCCFVVDFAAAQAVIENDLRGSEFADYSRIYDEDLD